MAENEIMRVGGQDVSFLAPFVEDDKSLEAMREHVVLPSVKCLQAMSAEELLKKFGPAGTTVLLPGDVVLAQSEEDSFDIVFLHFWYEFCKWADRKDKDSPMIIERTTDPTHPIAKRARDFDSMTELYPGHEGKPGKDQWYYRYVEHLRFTGVIYNDPELSGTIVCVSFEKGEFKVGRNLCTAAQMRRMTVEGPDGVTSVNVPLWAQVYTLKPTLRQKDSNKWYGLDFCNAENPMIDSSDAGQFKSEHERLTELHKANKITVDEVDTSGNEEGFVKGSEDF